MQKDEKLTPQAIITDNLLKEIKNLSTPGFYDKYPLFFKERVNLEDTMGIFKWLIDNQNKLVELSPRNTLRFGAFNPKGEKDYPFPMTIYIVMSRDQTISIKFDHNSKLARKKESDDIQKSQKLIQGRPIKFINKGNYKSVRHVTSFNIMTRKLERNVALVVKGQKNLNALRNEFKIIENFDLLDNGEHPLLILPEGYTEYSGHAPSQPADQQPKGIAFAPLMSGPLLNLVYKYKLDLADILWINYATVKAVAQFNYGQGPRARIHRDIKLENFLFMPNGHGYSIYLSDFGMGIYADESEKFSNGGTPRYFAYDSPIYKPIIDSHNAAINQINRFEKGQPLQTEQKLYQLYTLYRQQSQDPFEAATVYYEYLSTYILDGITRLPQGFHNADSCLDAIEIITKKTKCIELSPRNHISGDTYALCLMLKIINDKFEKYLVDKQCQPPQILLELSGLMKNNMEAGYQSRDNSLALLTKIEKLLSDFLTLSINDISPAGLAAYREKIKKQFRIHEFKLPASPIKAKEEQERKPDSLGVELGLELRLIKPSAKKADDPSLKDSMKIQSPGAS